VVLIADVASPWNDGVDFQQLRQAGIEAVAVKASEGATYRNPRYAKWVAEAQGAGLITFPYHFVSKDEPKLQWDNFVEAVGEPMPATVMLAVGEVDGECVTYHEYILRERPFERRVASGGALMLMLPRNVWFTHWQSESVRAVATYMFDARYVQQNGADVLTLRDSVPPAWTTAYGDRPCNGIQFTDSATIGETKDIGVTAADLSVEKLAALVALPNTTQPGDDVLSGELNKGDQAMTIISFPRGAFSHVSLGSNVLDEGADAQTVHIRLRVHTEEHQWGDPERLTVIYRVKTTYRFPSQNVDMVAVQRLDQPEATIGYDVA
jgi:Glycosyl hydrolases family 25